MSIEIDVLNGDTSWPMAKPLFDAVWPPEVVAKLPWAGIVFAHAELRILVQAEPEGALCHVGIYRREVTWNGRKMRAGGIGGVLTREDFRRRGYASIALDAAIRTLRDEGSADFAMLFCEPHNVPFYAGRGWKPFDGEIYCQQPEGRVRFTAIPPYLYSLKRAPLKGVIDLCGLPW
ncbi:MAG: GNAT family N-acetyltransferase [Bradyrhizobium sp.]|uniref:GNAT family N-acetyltransferase n=1 Tax=Bradyrhizobium sp. TaxID=376 RepID=UPI0011F6415A|nr:GNAT family N-acetyltransferase [Bradyrhizobium sp.]THD59589.1 MAG: GNAT family N-acetyltransferase [Bradyrhizobium sp.]